MTIAFNEPVTEIGLGITVISPGGRRVSLGRAREVNSSLIVAVTNGGQGTYTVSWRAVARDTHPTTGTYTFDVGHASAPATEVGSAGLLTPAGITFVSLASWLHFLGFALSFGSLAFGVVVLRRASDRRLLLLCEAGIVLLLVAIPLALLGQAASLGGPEQLDGPSLIDVLASPFGLVLALRAGAALMLWSLLGAFRLAGSGAAPGLAVGGAMAVVDAAASHALRALPGWAGWLALPANALHEAAMGVWVGGLAALLLTWRGRDWVPRRFARLVVPAVAALAISGVLLAAGSLRSPADLAITAYGRVIGLKSVLFAVALGLALLGLRGGIGRAWRVEATALAGLLGLAGVLVALPPPS